MSLRYPEIMGAIMAEVITVQLKKPDAAPIFPGYLILTISPIQATITEIMAELLSIPYIIRVIIIPGKEVTLERMKIMIAERGNTRIVTYFSCSSCRIAVPRRVRPGWQLLPEVL